MPLLPPNTRWDIFCRVIDNYGDIGICWRLARQLAHEHKQSLRLWVDDLASFQKICPIVNPKQHYQQVDGVEICLWSNTFTEVTPAEIVIEAFACQLPESYINAMATRAIPPLWINLEYLTYEPWSIDFHSKPSPQANQLNKYFFFPGLEKTGGLIREQNLIARAECFQLDTQAQQAFLEQLGVNKQPDALLMFIFSYGNNALGEWLDALRNTAIHYHLLVPQTPLLQNLAQYLKREMATLTPESIHHIDNLTLQIIPFVNQQDFDKLLWCCDYNLIRGEDSFVRAQYAGKPMLWHIYPQQDNTHLIKLEAFLDYYLQTLPTDIQQAIITWWQAWNTQSNLANAWFTYIKYLPEMNKHAKMWMSTQKTVTDLVTKLAKLYKN